MKLLIDLQGAQSESRHRGIGRYSLALALELVRQAGDDEVHILLNAQLHESIDELRATRTPERAGRAQDKESEDAFEKLRRDGYM